MPRPAGINLSRSSLASGFKGKIMIYAPNTPGLIQDSRERVSPGAELLTMDQSCSAFQCLLKDLQRFCHITLPIEL